MIAKRFVPVGLLALLCVFGVPAAVLAQSGIAGVVKDTSGAVLPGVTVVAASPALIEGSRTVVTDGQGLYRVVDLRPGQYSVTFSLTGFGTVKREGIELAASFTATVNVDMSVSTLEETVNVTGESPQVDIRNVVQERSISAAVIDAIPTARSASTIAQIIPGVSVLATTRQAGNDVGGLAGDRNKMLIHGGRQNDQVQLVDGLNWSIHDSAGANSNWTANPGEVQEYSYELAALPAENAHGGVRINIVPKEGGNVFHGSLFANFSNNSLQADNLDDNLKSKGLTAVNKAKLIEDINPNFGGPIIQNKLWFFGSYRWSVADQYVAGQYYALDPKSFIYTPDLNRQAVEDGPTHSFGARLTWQATQKNKFSAYATYQPRWQHHIFVAANRTPEASAVTPLRINQFAQATWKSPVTSRFLLEAGVQFVRTETTVLPIEDVPLSLNTISVLRQEDNVVFRAREDYFRNRHHTNVARLSGSFVNGSHAFKTGLDFKNGFRRQATEGYGLTDDEHGIIGAPGAGPAGYAYRTLNGVPNQITLQNTPRLAIASSTVIGLYAQDQWTIKRLTVNAGLRFDYLNGDVPAVQLGAGPFVPARNFPAVSDIPNWKDMSPRLGAVYDLFGDGRTALKVTWSRYVQQDSVDFTTANSPTTTSIASASRAWTDRNGNFVPDCDLRNPAAQTVTGGDICGALSDAAFGGTRITTRYDDGLRSGWGVRPFNTEFSASVQQQVLSGISLNVAFFRRAYGNFYATDNLALVPSDYNPYSVTAPLDSRLPNGGGYLISGLYDLNPSKLGQVNNLVTTASTYGKQAEIYKGIDVTTSVRLPLGIMVQGGLNTGTSQTVGNTVTNSTDRCFVVDNPQDLRFCNVSIPWKTQFKVLGTIALPWNLEAAATYQNTPGPQIQALWAAPSTLIAPSLGRPLSGGSNANVELIEPGTMYSDRISQMDVRLAKNIQVGRTRYKVMIDLYNATNANDVLLLNTTFGASWQRPTYVLPSRLIKFGAQIDF